MKKNFFAIGSLLLFSLALCATELPPNSEYVVVSKDGHLEQNGQRRRFWSAIGRVFTKTRAEKGDSLEVVKAKSEHIQKSNEILVKRLVDLGFNSIRLWAALPDSEDYIIGDASTADAVDNFIYQAKNAGFKIWVASLNRVGYVTTDDVNIIDDPTTEKAWQEAILQWEKATGIKAKKGQPKNSANLSNNLARIWDPRLEALTIKRMKEVATHKNKYTNLRWCDDPVFAVWEVTNEEWWMRRFLSGWTKLPDFFKESLYKKWNEYLSQKYTSDKELIAAWGEDSILKGESLKDKNLVFAPTQGQVKLEVRLNDGNAFAISAVQADTSEKGYSRDDFSAARAADLLEFSTQIWLEHKQRIVAALKPLGKSTSLCPWIYDTGIGYDIQSQYIHQHADAVAHDAYLNGWGDGTPLENLENRIATVNSELQKRRVTLDAERINSTDDVWRDALKLPPGVCSGVPWLEHNKIEGKPFLCYETQIQQPAKYRAGFPIQLATLSSLQNWDWVCWHYFAIADDITLGKDSETPWTKAMDYTSGSHPQGYHFTYDEVQVSVMRAAAYIFINNLIAPIAKPTKFIYGRKRLYDPDSMDYAGSYGVDGYDMLQTTYQHGVRIEIDPTIEEDKVIGPVVKYEERNTFNPYTPTPEVLIDWKKGFIKFDAPGVATFAGTMGNYGDEIKFSKDNIVLKNVKMHNPKGAIYPITDKEKYIAFNIYSESGEELSKANKIGLSLVSTSMNANYTFPNKIVRGKPVSGKSSGLPLVTRVSATVEASFLKNMKYKFYNWHLKVIDSGVLSTNSIDIPADQEIFYVELTR